MSLILVEFEDGKRAHVDEGLLVKTEGVDENDDCRTAWVEYRFPDSNRIMHRSVHVTMKRWPEGLGADIASFG
jgi:hypothetical protein